MEQLLVISVFMVNHHTDPVAVDCGTVSIHILLASMNRVDLGAIFNHHGYYFVFHVWGQLMGVKETSQKLMESHNP